MTRVTRDALLVLEDGTAFGGEAFTALQDLLSTHRVWERFPASVA